MFSYRVSTRGKLRGILGVKVLSDDLDATAEASGLMFKPRLLWLRSDHHMVLC